MARRSTRQKDSAAVERVSSVRRPTGKAVVGRGDWKTGFCGTTRLHSLCPAEIRNGRRARHRVMLCTCDCHGDIGKRRTALRERLREESA